MKHPTPIEIGKNLHRSSETAVRDHLETCVECNQTARAINALAEPLAWEIASLPESEPLSSPSQSVPLNRLNEAEKLRHIDPAAAVEICDEILRLPDCTSETEEGHHLSVLVLRERANASRFRGDLRGALDTIERARSLANELLVSDYENAVLDYIQASVLHEMDELDRSVELAIRARSTLTLFGDSDRARKASFVAAAVQYKTGDFEPARRTCLEILESMSDGDDEATRAGLLLNLTTCEIRVERFQDARAHAREAEALLKKLGMATELTRLRWAEARMALAQGYSDRADRLLQETEASFREAGYDLDAALVSLELLELHENQGNRDDVVQIATRLAAIFAEAGAKMSLATTLAKLRDAAVSGDDVKEPILTARKTIEQLMAQG